MLTPDGREELIELIESHCTTEAVRLATTSPLSARAIISSFAEDAKSTHSRAFVWFAQAWHTAAPVDDKLAITRWVSTDAVLAFADVEDVRLIAAQLLVEMAEETLAFLSALTDDAWVLADGPDAGISEEMASEITRTGEALRATRWPRV